MIFSVHLHKSSLNLYFPCFAGQLAKIPATASSSAKLGANPRKASALVSDERVRKRYFDELKAIDCCSSSDDDNYPEGPPASLTKKQKRHLSTIQASLSSDIQPIQSTLTPNIYNRLVMADTTTPSSKIEAKMDVPVDASTKKSNTETKRSAGDDFKPVIDVLSRVIGSKNIYEINEESYRVMISRHRAQKREGNCKFESSEKEVIGGEARLLEEIGQRVRICALNKRASPAKVETPKKAKVIPVPFLK